MAGVSATNLPIATQPVATPSSSASTPAASPQQAPAQAGFSQKDTFTPSDQVGDFTGQLNSQASGRADLVEGWFAKSANLLGNSNRAHSWHQLIMEMIRLQRPG